MGRALWIVGVAGQQCTIGNTENGGTFFTVVIHHRLTNIGGSAFPIQIIANLIGVVEHRAAQVVDVSNGVITYVHADIPNLVQYDVGIDVDCRLSVGATFSPDRIVTIVDATRTIYDNGTCIAGGHCGVLFVGADVDPHVIRTVDVNLAVVSDLLIIFRAAVTHGDTVVLAVPRIPITVDDDVARIQYVAGCVADQNSCRVTDTGAQGDETVVNNLLGAFGHNPGAQAGTTGHDDILGQVTCVTPQVNSGIGTVGKGRISRNFHAKGGAVTVRCTVFTSVDDVNIAVIDAFCLAGQLHTNGQRQ